MGLHRFGGENKYKCPICGKENYAHETFRCRRCGKQYLCVEHLDNREKVCEKCVTVREQDKEQEAGMVQIHGGEFTMGCDEADLNCQPAHKLKIDPFQIDKHPVTNAQYKEFNPDHQFPEGKEDDPVVGVTWTEARDYAVWAGKRIPTEEQWEKAARGTDARRYPWGEDLPEQWLKGAGDDFIIALKRYNLSPYGVRDMVGGLYEWTASNYEPYRDGDASDPAYFQGSKVIRGGITGFKPASAWDRNHASPNERRNDITFRCVKEPPKEKTLIQFVGFDIKSREEKEEIQLKRGVIDSRQKAKSVTDPRARILQPGVEPPVKPVEPLEDRITPPPRGVEPSKPPRYEPVKEKPSFPIWIIILIAIVIIAIIVFVAVMKATSKGLQAREAIYCIEHDEGKTFISRTNPGSKVLERISTAGTEREPTVSRNGRLIGFISERDGRPDIFVMKPNGKDWMNLTKGGSEKEHPAITPDGKRIYFAHKSAGGWDIFRCTTDGEGMEPVVQTQANERQPSISCDGKHLAFISDRNNELNVVVTNPDGKDERTIAKDASMKSYPVFTPDPGVIAYRCNKDGNYEVYYGDIAKGEIFRGTETYRNEGRFDFNGAGDYLIMCWDNPTDQKPSGLFSIRWDGTNFASIIEDEARAIEMPYSHLGGMCGYWASKSVQDYKKTQAKKSQPVKRLAAISVPKTLGPTGITVKKNDLISFEVQNWDLTNFYKAHDDWVLNGEKTNNPPDPPLMIEIGEGPRLYVGPINSFRSEWDGEIKLIHMGEKIVVPQGAEKFIVEIEVT